ncbi:hypothetical protein B0J17DRAFT_634132 [Rhizoctonia solani]|nr:hypothetical protein B0J17DRAFT_634132 [Rhizoctonia solani]
MDIPGASYFHAHGACHEGREDNVEGQRLSNQSSEVLTTRTAPGSFSPPKVRELPGYVEPKSYPSQRTKDAGCANEGYDGRIAWMRFETLLSQYPVLSSKMTATNKSNANTDIFSHSNASKTETTILRRSLCGFIRSSQPPIYQDLHCRSQGPGFKGFSEGAGCVSIQAVHPKRSSSAKGATWQFSLGSRRPGACFACPALVEGENASGSGCEASLRYIRFSDGGDRKGLNIQFRLIRRNNATNAYNWKEKEKRKEVKITLDVGERGESSKTKDDSINAPVQKRKPRQF